MHLKLLWVDPDQQLTHPHSCSLNPPTTAEWKERIGRANPRNPVGWNKDSLISEGKRGKNNISDAKAITHCLPQAHCFPDRLWATAPLEAQPCAPFSLHPSFYCRARCCQFKSAIPAVSPSNLSLLACLGAGWEKVFLLCTALVSSSQELGVLPTLF